MYTNAQLQQLWIQNGGNVAAAPMAAAIAQAESSGNPNATNHNTNGTTDRGVWQVNSIWGNLSTYDANANAKAAIQISHNGSNWGPWSTYNAGAYRKFLGAATAPLPAGSSTSPSTRSSSSPAAAAGLFGQSSDSEFLYAAVWIGALIAGAWLLYTGLDRSTHGKVSGAARDVAKTAQLAKLAAA